MLPRENSIQIRRIIDHLPLQAAPDYLKFSPSTLVQVHCDDRVAACQPMCCVWRKFCPSSMKYNIGYTTKLLDCSWVHLRSFGIKDCLFSNFQHIKTEKHMNFQIFKLYTRQLISALSNNHAFQSSLLFHLTIFFYKPLEKYASLWLFRVPGPELQVSQPGCL